MELMGNNWDEASTLPATRCLPGLNTLQTKFAHLRQIVVCNQIATGITSFPISNQMPAALGDQLHQQHHHFDWGSGCPQN